MSEEAKGLVKERISGRPSINGSATLMRQKSCSQ